MKGNLKIPYGISDFKRVRSEGYYYIDKSAYWYRVPNICVRRQVFDYIRKHLSRTRKPNWTEWPSLAAAFAYDGEWKPFLERLAQDFAETNPVRGGIQGEHRIQGYMQAEFGHLDYYLVEPEMELSRGFCDFCLFPERFRSGDVQHSYIVELKYSAKDAPDVELDAKRREALDQLAKCRADPATPSLARGTTLHQIVFQFRGTELVRLEHVTEDKI